MNGKPRAGRRSSPRARFVAWSALALAAAFVAAAALAAVPSALTGTGEPDERLRRRLESAAAGADVAVGDERVHAVASLARFYEERRYVPAWWRDGRPTAAAAELVREIGRAGAEGLRPGDYHLAAIERRWPAPGSPVRDAGRLVDLELLLSDAFLLLGSHYLSGRINPETIDPEWFVSRRGGDPVDALWRAVEEGRVVGALADLLPRQPGYAVLRRALAEHRAIADAGGWPQVPDGPKLERGADGERVAALRARLLGPPDETAHAPFDDALEAAVRAFQEAHGLEPDGVVGAKTLTALNVPAAARARQIVVNMERWRWLPQDLGGRHVLVNIAGFRLELRAAGAEPLLMKVIVGRDYRRTPVFSDRITHLVLNPHWEVPHNIAVQDILPQIRKDPGYLSRQGMELLGGWGADERRIDPDTIDWASVTRATFRYRLRQSPGPKNALGRIKFMFPNRFNVYLHDTPARELFAKAERAFSSGCIRVERPLELAERLLAPAPDWTRARLEEAIGSGRERTVGLPEPVPVHLLYWTAWVEGPGGVRFRNDVYGRDRPLAEALGEAPPPAATPWAAGEARR